MLWADHGLWSNHWAEIKSGKVTYRIVGTPDRDFPKVPDHREVSYTTLESAVLREMIERPRIRACRAIAPSPRHSQHGGPVFASSEPHRNSFASYDELRATQLEQLLAR
jgi:hypothetical protein